MQQLTQALGPTLGANMPVWRPPSDPLPPYPYPPHPAMSVDAPTQVKIFELWYLYFRNLSLCYNYDFSNNSLSLLLDDSSTLHVPNTVHAGTTTRTAITGNDDSFILL